MVGVKIARSDAARRGEAGRDGMGWLGFGLGLGLKLGLGTGWGGGGVLWGRRSVVEATPWINPAHFL